MSKKRKLAPDQQAAFEEEQMNRPVNLSGTGELPAVKALLDPDFVKMSDFDVTDVALMLQQIIRGQNSLLAKAEDNTREINIIKERMAKNDLAMEGRFNAQRSEMEDVLDRASKLKATGDKKDQIIARGAAQYTQAIHEARAKNSMDKAHFEDELRRQPQVQVVSPGVWEQVREGQMIIPKIRPEEIRIKHLRFTLPPGVPVMVPQAVADQLNNRRRSQVETQTRKEILSKNMEQSKLATAWNNVEGSKTENMPLA